MTNFDTLKNAETVEDAAVILEDYTLDFHIKRGRVNIAEWLGQETASKKELRLKMLLALTKAMGDMGDMED